MKLYTNNLRRLCLLVSLILLLTAMLPACSASSEPPTEVTDRLLNQIESDYMQILRKEYDWNIWVDGKCRIEYCYGIYNGCVPVMFSGNYIQITQDVEIDGIVFHYRNGNSIKVWNGGTFYSLEDARTQNLLSQEDLSEIANIHNNVRYPSSE